MTTPATISNETPLSPRLRAGRTIGLARLTGLAIALAGCTVSDPDGAGATVVETPAQGAASAGAGGGQTAGDVPTNGAPGTRQNPVPAGTTVKIGDWQVRFAATNPNANQQIAAENQFNAPLAAGRQFVLVPVEVTYTGDESGTAWIDLSIKFLGAGGNTFGGGPQEDYCGVIPNALTDLGEMFPGAKGSGNECVSVPADQIEGGAWIVEQSFALDDNRVFFALS